MLVGGRHPASILVGWTFVGFLRQPPDGRFQVLGGKSRSMLPDTLLDFTDEEAISYATILAAVATCDGKFTPEEMSGYEARIASLLFQPFVRERLNSMIGELVDLKQHLDQFSQSSLRLLLRDAVLMAACDGEYKPEEIEIIEQIAAAANIDEDTLNQLYFWVSEGWSWQRRGHNILKIVHQPSIAV